MTMSVAISRRATVPLRRKTARSATSQITGPRPATMNQARSADGGTLGFRRRPPRAA
jgi:hypothetical protein